VQRRPRARSRVSDPHPFHADTDPDPGLEKFADADPDLDPGLHFCKKIVLIYVKKAKKYLCLRMKMRIRIRIQGLKKMRIRIRIQRLQKYGSMRIRILNPGKEI